ncbi:helix-turn-helix domain-containing protein [Patescibacteria group bacterium]|nr:helix-turn-helix domain-containing protein [Patescibacteria group bacterium]
MVTFKKKSLFEKPITLGEKLKNAREKEHLSLERVVKNIGIKKKYLKSLEDNNLKGLPGGLYAKKFIKQYSKYLNLDQDEIDKHIEKLLNHTDSHNNYFSHKKLSKKRFLVFPKIVRTILIITVVLACLLYLGFYFNNLISPPQLKIISPQPNQIINKGFVDIKGETDPETEVYINGSTVLIDDNSYFEKKINLKKGLNKIIIEAKQRYSRTNTKTRQIKFE